MRSRDSNRASGGHAAASGYDYSSQLTSLIEKQRIDEKRALAKAKEGIREQKNAQRRIAKIKADMAAEQDIMMSAAITRQEREAERNAEE